MKTIQRTYLYFLLVLIVTACGPAAVTDLHPSGDHANGEVQTPAGQVEPTLTSEPAAEAASTPGPFEVIAPTADPSPTATHSHSAPSPTPTTGGLAASPTPEFEVPLDLVLLEPTHQSVTKNTLFRLSWQAYPGAAYYEVLLLHDHAHAFLDHERVEGTSFAFGKAQQPGDYDWVVEAFNTAGEKIASSPGWYFSVEP